MWIWAFRIRDDGRGDHERSADHHRRRVHRPRHCEGNEDLTIRGRLEGSLSLSGKLTVADGATVHADVSVREAWIQGVLVGNIDATDKVHIARGGRVAGDIRAPQVILEEGAAYRGGIDMGEFDLTPDEPQLRREPASSETGPVMPAPRVSPGFVQGLPAQPEPVPATSQRRVVEPARRAPAPRPAEPAGRPPMPVPSKPVAPAMPEVRPERRGAPAPRVRPVGRVKVKKPTL